MSESSQLISNIEYLLSISSDSNNIRQVLIDLAVNGKLSDQDSSETVEEWVEEYSEYRDDILCPKNWRIVQLGKLGRIFNGSSLSEAEKKSLEKNANGIPFIATKDIGYGTQDINYNNGWLVPLENSKYKRAAAGTLLICLEGGSAGKKMGIVNQEVCFGNKMFAIELRQGLLAEYLQIVYQSSYFQDQFSSLVNGIISGISKKKFEKIFCPIPPVEEQKRIVNSYWFLMDKVHSIIKSRHEAETFQNKSRESLVNLLISSSYGDEFRSEYRNFLDRFGLYTQNINSIFELKRCFLDLAIRGAFSDGFDHLTSDVEVMWKLPNGWDWIPLSKLIDPERGITYGIIKLGKEPKMSGVPVLRCSDVKYRKFDLSGMRKVEQSVSQQFARTILQGGEVLVNIRGTLGGCAIVPNDFAGFNIAREVAAMMPVAISADYLLAVLSSNYFTDHVINSLRGISYKGINLALLRKTLIPVPPRPEEKRLVKLINETMSLFDSLEATVLKELKLKKELEGALKFEVLSTISKWAA